MSAVVFLHSLGGGGISGGGDVPDHWLFDLFATQHFEEFLADHPGGCFTSSALDNWLVDSVTHGDCVI